MKTIEISDELYNKLIELSTNINNQSHRATAMPYFFQIQTKEQVPAPEGCGIEAWHQDGSMLETDEEINSSIYDYHDGEMTEETIKELSYSEKEEMLEEAGWRKVNYDYKNKYENAFLTEKSCKKHIELNKHHYYKPVDYLSHAFRNPDLETVFEFLCGLTGKALHK